MSEVLNDFIRALRAADVRVSTSESIDAGKALGLVGFEDRQMLRDALAQALAKTGEEKSVFGETFDRFFAFRSFDPLALQGDEAAAAAPEGTPRQASAGAGGSGGAQGQTPSGAPCAQGLTQMLESGDLAALEMSMAEAARQIGLNRIRIYTQRNRYVLHMLEAMGVDAVDEEIQRREQTDPRGAATLHERRQTLRQQVLDYVEKQLELFSANSGRRLREEVLSRLRLNNISPRDMQLMHELVRKVAKRLVALHSRRRKVDMRGHLDVRRTIRANVEFGGPIFHTIWKQKKVDRPKVMALCDVSGSVAQVSVFLLLFLYSLQDLLPRVRSFAFSETLGETTALFDQEQNIHDAIAGALKRYGMGATDYGKAFAEFERLAGEDIDHRTTVLVLGDARSNYSDPRGDILKKIHARARRVIWLNPEPKQFWGRDDSEMPRLRAYCDTVKTCASLQDLERIVSELLRHAS